MTADAYIHQKNQLDPHAALYVTLRHQSAKSIDNEVSFDRNT